MTNDASEYLSEQISYLKRAAKLNYATAFLLSALVAGYGAFAFWAMSPFTNADELSNYTLHRVAASAPEFIEATEQTLASRSGEFADGLSVALQKAIPQMRQSAERTLNAMLGNGFADAETKLTEITRAYLESHDFPPRSQKETMESYANRVADTLAKDFGENLDATLYSATGATLGEFNQNTDTVLAMFDKHLGELASTPSDKLSRSQKAERLLIAYLIQNFLPKATQGD